MSPDIKTSNNFEIDQALKEFDVKAGEQQMQKAPEASKVSEIPQREVSGIKFETDSYKAIKFYDETDTPKIVRLVMKYSGGTIKEQKTAEYVLLGFVVVAFIVSLFLFFGVPNLDKSSSRDRAAMDKILQLRLDSIKK